jgi:hypothetical protein
MKKFKDKQDLTDWAYQQFKQFNVPLPETYSADEIKQFCPDIPADFIERHVEERDERTLGRKVSS